MQIEEEQRLFMLLAKGLANGRTIPFTVGVKRRLTTPREGLFPTSKGIRKQANTTRSTTTRFPSRIHPYKIHDRLRRWIGNTIEPN